MNPSLLHSFRMTVSERNLGVYGVHVFKKGEEPLEHRFRSDNLVNLYSASKTFTSVGIGICIDEGALSLEDKALSFFPEYKDIAVEGSEAITLRDLLHMASGKDIFWCEPDDEKEKDAAEIFFRTPQSWKSGAHFLYSNFCTYMLGRIVEKVRGQTLRDFLVDRLFTPLCIFNPQWMTCLRGHTVAATGLMLRTQDLAKLGRLLLQEGQWEGKQVVSADYVKRLHTDVIDCSSFAADPESSQTYGYQVWSCTEPGIYRADGMYGQFSLIMPAKEAVVTLTSHEERGANDIIRAVFQDIMPLL